MKCPFLFLSKVMSLAFRIWTGTSASSSESNFFKPNCRAAHSLKISFVPSLQSGQERVKEFPMTGALSTLNIC